MQGPDLNTNDNRRCLTPWGEKNRAQRGFCDLWRKSQRRLLEEAAVSCVSGMQRGGWRSGQMECGEQERNMSMCAGNIGKEDAWTGKVYWSPTEGVS